MVASTKNTYTFSEDGKVGYGGVSTGLIFIFDSEDFEKICHKRWYQFNRGKNGIYYIGDSKGNAIHRLIMNPPKGYEVDHIDLNPLNNSKRNLRICTHQQNQYNQPLQINNTSGFCGVRYYSPRKKYIARIKLNQKDIHLGYYETIIEAAQARNVATELLFGEYGVISDVAEPPDWIIKKVLDKCSRLVNKAAVFI